MERGDNKVNREEGGGQERRRVISGTATLGFTMPPKREDIITCREHRVEVCGQISYSPCVIHVHFCLP
jgi:hypothetical protein